MPILLRECKLDTMYMTQNINDLVRDINVNKALKHRKVVSTVYSQHVCVCVYASTHYVKCNIIS